MIKVFDCRRHVDIDILSFHNTLNLFIITGEFGWHPSNIHRVYEKELASGKPDLEWWHPGRLLHYGRAELKTSDHRPVIALLEVDIFRVDEKERERVRKEVVEAMGPADATVIVSPVNVEQNPINTSSLVDVLQQYGAIVLVRCVPYLYQQSG